MLKVTKTEGGAIRVKMAIIGLDITRVSSSARTVSSNSRRVQTGRHILLGICRMVVLNIQCSRASCHTNMHGVTIAIDNTGSKYESIR